MMSLDKNGYQLVQGQIDLIRPRLRPLYKAHGAAKNCPLSVSVNGVLARSNVEKPGDDFDCYCLRPTHRRAQRNFHPANRS